MHENTGRLALATSKSDKALIARLSGEIDLSNANALLLELTRAATAMPPPELAVLDLTAVSFFSAAAIHAVYDFAAACADRGVRTHLVIAPEDVVYRVVFLTGLDKRLPTFASIDQAAA